MREIKFRAWDKVTNKMVLPEKASGWKLHFNGSVDYKESWATGDLDIMQFTGLKDKNGKEIYEGDIVIADGQKGDVVYTDLLAQFDFRIPTGGGWGISKSLGSIDEVEVIGNIYENPELLK